MADQPKSIAFLLEHLGKLANYVLGVSIVLYLFGFAISNLYLSSLGVSSLSLLHARYVLVGLLFGVFVGLIGFLVYGLVETLKRNRGAAPLKLIGRILVDSFLHLSVPIVIVPLLVLLSGSTAEGVRIRPQPSLPTTEEVLSELTEILEQAGIYLAVVIGLAVVIAVAVLIAEKRNDASDAVQDGSANAKSSKNLAGILLGSLGGLFVFLFLLLLVFRILTFIATGDVGAQSFTNASPSLLPGGWSYYLGGVVAVYVLIGMFILIPYVMQSSSLVLGEINPVRSLASNITLIGVLALIVVALYVGGIYPKLPQQLGGGHFIVVELTLADSETSDVLSQSGVTTLLLDRTSTTTFILLADNSNGNLTVLEIANSQILSIAYPSNP